MPIGPPLRTVLMDRLRMHCRGGVGGQGVPKHGGIGGRGGNVYLVGESRCTLEEIKKANAKRRFSGEAGQHSQKYLLVGAAGRDKEISVPLGVEAVLDTGHLLGEVNEEGERLLIASGGEGGTLATHYNGSRGEVVDLNLELKLMADVALVGFPNAGKSTLLTMLSGRQAKIGEYAFTTVRPQVGVIQYEDKRSISLADLPGLIEGAHRNVGMGHSFLKHVERANMLTFFVDVQGFQLKDSSPRRSAVQTVQLLARELELYREDLLHRPALLVFNKMDTSGAEELYEEASTKLSSSGDSSIQQLVQRLPTFRSICGISALDGTGLSHLRAVIRQQLDDLAEEARDQPEPPVVLPDGLSARFH